MMSGEPLMQRDVREAAPELGCNEEEAALDKKLKRIANAAPPQALLHRDLVHLNIVDYELAGATSGQSVRRVTCVAASVQTAHIHYCGLWSLGFDL
jgi:hypothetical protein